MPLCVIAQSRKRSASFRYARCVFESACSQSMPCSTPAIPLASAGLEVGFLIGGQTVLGAQPGEDGLVVVGGLQQALRLRAPVQAAGTVKFGRHDEPKNGSYPGAASAGGGIGKAI